MYGRVKKIKKMIEEYYKKGYIKHLIRENVIDRDFSVLGKNNANIRALQIKCLFDFDRIIKLIRWKEKKQNFYRSVAKLREIPQFTFNPKKRSEEHREWYVHDYPNLIYEYDLFCDFDKDEQSTFEQVLDEVKTLLRYLEDYGVTYYILFSGSKGFQVVIDGKFMPRPKIIKGCVFPIKEGDNLSEKLYKESVKLDDLKK